MATIPTTITLSAADLARAIPALKNYFGLPTAATNAQILAEWSLSETARLRGIVKDYERANARKTAEDGVTDIVLT